MTQDAPVLFRKMNGAGNDFVVLDARAGPLPLNEVSIRAICERKTGLGCEQLLVMEKADDADIFMRIYNADGGETEACGNGTRCIGRLMMDETGKSSVTIATLAGTLRASDGGSWDKVTVDMLEPLFAWNDIPLAEPFRDTRAIELQFGPIDAPLLHSPAVVNMRVPHTIFFVDDLDCVDLGQAGLMLEHHPIFPEGSNISLARVDARDHLTVKTWERGSGLTRACGTGACAAAVCAMRKRMIERRATVTLPGGDLMIEWRERDNHVLMTGPVEMEGDGTVPPHLFKENVHAG